MLQSTSRSQPTLDRDAGLPPEPDYVSFLDISRFLKRNLIVITSCFLIAAALAVAFVYTSPQRFTARAQILIDAANTPQLVRDAGGPERSLDTAQVEGQVAVLRSESLAYNVIDKLHLTDDPEFQAAP